MIRCSANDSRACRPTTSGAGAGTHAAVAGRGDDAVGSSPRHRRDLPAPARTGRFAPEHPLMQVLANQALNADQYGDAARIAAYQHGH